MVDGLAYGRVDGKYASSAMDLNIVTAIGAWRLWSRKPCIRGTLSENQTLSAILDRLIGLVTGGIPRQASMYRLPVATGRICRISLA